MRYLLLLLTVTAFTNEFHPWWTGSLLSLPGHNVARKETNIQPYVFFTDDYGHYDNKSRKQSQISTKKINPQFLYTYGFTDWFNVKVIPQMFINSEGGQTSVRLGDFPFVLAFQAFSENPHTWKPSLRIILRETFPTGHHDRLNPKKKGTDASGNGSFETALGFNFQKTHQLWNIHYLRWRLNLVYTVPSPVGVHGLSIYGGARGTRGTAYPGNVFTGIFALEFNFNQNWVLACDLMDVWSAKTRFSGRPGTTLDGTPATVGSGVSSTLSIAPALEYNFTKNFGLIGGVWTSLTGKNSEDFISYVISVNYVY